MGKSFYIIDGHAQIYRAYFAPFRELTSPAGEPTKATFVFTQMLLNLIEQRKPDYLAMAIDSGDENVFRKAIYPQYKANRKAPEPDFFPQERRILQIVRDAGIPIFQKPAFEADDLIATMARRSRELGFDVYLVSKDKDLRQLLSERVRMYDVQSDEELDAQTMQARFGYSPQQAIEIQTLMGDPTDNVPGISGVGDKTALELIRQFGSAEQVIARAAEITKPKLRENVRQFVELMPISRQLVTLKDDVEMDFDPQSCAFLGLNHTAVTRHLRELGFTALLHRLEAEKGTQLIPESLFGSAPTEAEVSTSAGAAYELIDTEAKLQKFLAELKHQKLLAFDTETDALGAMRSNLVGMSFSWKRGSGYYIAVAGPIGSQHLDHDKTIAAIKPILEDSSIHKIGHNIKYDMLAMRSVGVQVRGVVMDTMIAAFLLDASRLQYGIDRLALDLLNFRKIATEELIGKGRNQLSMQQIAPDRVARYAAEDADIALRLHERLESRLRESPELRKLHDDVENPLVDVLVEMEFNGIAVDPAILRQQSEVLGQRIDELRDRIHKEAGAVFNPDSPKQLGEVLFNRLKLKAAKKTKTGFSTDVEVLEKLAAEHPVPRLVLEYRSLVKLKGTYLDALAYQINPRTGRIHTSFNQIGAQTGRLSSSDPNLQNIPIRTDEGRRIRLAFVPADRQHNVLLTADYSQIELRVLAHFCQEPALLRAFELDQDIHAAVAAEVFAVPLDQVTKDQRAQAKIINFGIIYGITAMGLARRIDGLSLRAADELIKSYNKRFPRIKQFLEQCVMQAQSQGYVRTILGRRRPIGDIRSAVLAQRNAAERMAINSVVQGSAADLIKVAMLNIHRRLRSENRPSKMLLQVHDELVFETPADAVQREAEMIRAEMTGALKLCVPLKVDVGWGKNWQEVK